MVLFPFFFFILAVVLNPGCTIESPGECLKNTSAGSLVAGGLASVFSDAPQVVRVHGQGLESLTTLGVCQSLPGHSPYPSPDL